MSYPFWDIPIGYGIMMGCIAVLHVFIAHFAIGGGLYLVLTERWARLHHDQHTLDFLEKLSQFFVLTTLVMGALTGVGIWFIIGLLNPQATEVLIHHFVWAWALEWTFFITEIAAAIFYYYGWKTLSAKGHMIIGWIYFISAWMSLFVINGIVTFMLTPGQWLLTGNFWDGFFNPTFWPSLVFRTGICVMLAGFYSLFFASFHQKKGTQERLIRRNAIWGLVGLALMVPSFYWYWKAIPSDFASKALTMMRLPIEAMVQGFWFAGIAGGFLILWGLIFPRQWNRVIAILLMLCGLMIFGKFEWFRESIRKPYVISGYMYGNSVEVAQASVYQQEGYLKQLVYRTGNDGADLFRRSCQSCHTIDGYRPLKPAFDGTDQEFISSIIKGAHVLKGNMPPFYGTAKEAALLASYIKQNIDQRHLSEIYNLQGVELGKKVYEIRCGKCHVRGGYHDKTQSLIAFGADNYDSLIDMADDLGDEMPAFTGDQVEREALIEFLKTLKR